MNWKGILAYDLSAVLTAVDVLQRITAGVFRYDAIVMGLEGKRWMSYPKADRSDLL